MKLKVSKKQCSKIKNYTKEKENERDKESKENKRRTRVWKQTKN